jgi:hypothetical protein
MKTYTNNIEINGQVFTNTVEATDYAEALRINKRRKEDAAMKGRRIFGRLLRNDC